MNGIVANCLGREVCAQLPSWNLKNCQQFHIIKPPPHMTNTQLNIMHASPSTIRSIQMYSFSFLCVCVYVYKKRESGRDKAYFFIWLNRKRLVVYELHSSTFNHDVSERLSPTPPDSRFRSPLWYGFSSGLNRQRVSSQKARNNTNSIFCTKPNR